MRHGLVIWVLWAPDKLLFNKEYISNAHLIVRIKAFEPCKNNVVAIMGGQEVLVKNYAQSELWW